jgi:hypothetical protein
MTDGWSAPPRAVVWVAESLFAAAAHDASRISPSTRPTFAGSTTFDPGFRRIPPGIAQAVVARTASTMKWRILSPEWEWE